MIARLGGRVRSFFRSMAGQIFVILTLGMTVAAIIALLVAEQTRRHDFERVRRQRVVASAVDIANRLQRDAARTEAMMADHSIGGAAPAPPGVALAEPDTALQEALVERLGPRSQPEAGQVPTGLCFVSYTNRWERAAGLIDAPRPDCWIVRFTDHAG